MSETVVGIRQLKANLSGYMGQVKAGQTVVITERGKPIGRIIPEAPAVSARLQALVAAGLAEWSGEQLSPRHPTVVNRSEKLVSELVVEMRE
jgi:prevent-host-death family protein